MKNQLIILLLTLCSLGFSQNTIENPEYGYSTYPGEILKIEMHDTITVMHFKIKKLPWGYFHLHEESYIITGKDADKKFVTKLTGANYGRNDFPESGEVTYQLYFPALDKNVKTFDFGVEKDRGWHVYDIVIKEDQSIIRLPKELRGNWLLADGSNRWDYGFNGKNAIVERKVWKYKSVDQKGKKYTITLENNNDTKTVYAKLGKNGIVSLGNSTNELVNYSLEKVFDPDVKIQDDMVFNTIDFDLGSTTYSGVVKGFSDNFEQKTGMVYVDNPFIGDQESHLIKINDDGSFKTNFPITHPQTVFVRMPNGAFSVFVEPNKETFHYLDGSKSFFMGDNAKINTDLLALKDIQNIVDIKVRKEIGTLSPEEYKSICIEMNEENLKKLDAFQKNNHISNKALQIKNWDLKLQFYQSLLGYDMYRSSLQSQNNRAKKEEDKYAYTEFEISDDYYDFLPKGIINERLPLLTSNYYFFVNRLVYADILNPQLSSKLTNVEIADWLQKNDIELSAEELNMVEMSKKIETPEILAKEEEFREKYGNIEKKFYKKYTQKEQIEVFNSFMKEGKGNEHNHFILNMVVYLDQKGIKLSQEEEEMVEALKILKSPEEIEAERQFNIDYRVAQHLFYKKYKDHQSEIFNYRKKSSRDNKIKEFFGVREAFLYDVISLNDAYKRLKDYDVYSDDELAIIQKDIKSPFLKEYIATANKRTKEKIKLNKNKGDYNVHEVEKSEGDELFDAMIDKFKGKVVYVDFWATWCGPCKLGIKRIVPLKEEMIDEDVVFLYITNQSSPENTWKNAIANIKGEHYRVSKDEWNYLVDKFKITGIPHYTLVNKEGDIVKPKLNHMTNDRLRSVLKEEINK